MGIFKKLLTGITSSNVMGKYGTLEDWQKASPNELKKYKENIKLGVEQKTVPKIILGSFLMVEGKGEEEEGERILREAMDEGVENAERDYSAALAYYYMQKGKFNTALKKDKWFPKWIEASEKCVEQGYKNAESILADIYIACYSLNDPEFEEIVIKIIKLLRIATAKHQSMACLSYGRFIQNKLSSNEYKQKNTSNYQNLESAKPYFLQAIKDEKGTQFESSAYEAMISYYNESIHRDIKKAIESYLSKDDISGISTKIDKTYEEALKYVKSGDEKSKIATSILNNYVVLFDFLNLAILVKGKDDKNIVADNYIWQMDEKRFSDKAITIKNDIAMDILSQYYLDNLAEIKQNNLKIHKPTTEYMEKRKETRSKYIQTNINQYNEFFRTN
ncbi:hypothetical protein HBP99_11935 [Listeria booriae]|uniref:hypothetical protein n=1 Tax=Listeria booriae TaxID=1552123 RepID=UPI001628A2C0|nr:hypothetical protein [Listeria booriae]MBC2369349.1 hypothetical protein [Listeria booriae]